MVGPALIGEQAGRDVVSAKLQQAISPPLHAAQPLTVAGKGQETEVVDAVLERRNLVVQNAGPAGLRIRQVRLQQDTVGIQFTAEHR